MPLPWSRPKTKSKAPAPPPNLTDNNASDTKEVTAERPVYTFYCQLAHGSPTGVISQFSNVKELYEKIAQCYDIDPKEILFCTLNSHKVDMDMLLGGQLGLDDFIFAHVKGQRKEVEVDKHEDALGLTITDNGAGYAFIKRIKEGSIVDKLGADIISVGDHIEKIDDICFVDRRHFDVARALKDIPKGTTFTLRLISPEKTPFGNLAPRSAAGGKGIASISSGKKTLRLKAGAVAKEDESTDVQTNAVRAINSILESVLGVDDSELALTIWELGRTMENPHDFSVALDRDLGEFGFSDEAIFDFWGSIDDAKAGRLLSTPSRSIQPNVFVAEF